jgi:hypothetical protein
VATRDTYEILLQLRDELSANLKLVNANLGKTATAGKQAAGGISGIRSSMKQALQPMKDFQMIFRQIMGMGGLAYVLRKIATEISDMEKAFLKLNPEMRKVTGSAFQFGAAMEASKASFGGLVAEMLGPARGEIIAMIQEWSAGLKKSGDDAAEVGNVIGQVVRYGVKVFATLGRAVYDNFNLMVIAVKTVYQIIRSVGEFIWLPIKKGFLTIISPIREQFAALINWLLSSVEEALRWIGGALQKITFGKVGGGMAGLQMGRVSAEDLKPENVQLKTWNQVAEEIKATFGEVGVELQKVLNAYVDIWQREPGAATLYAIPPTEAEKAAADALKKWQEEYLKNLLDRVTLLKDLNKQAVAAALATNTQHAREAEEQRKLDEERNKLLREMRKGQLDQAMGFFQDPMAAISGVGQTALGNTAAGNAGEIGGLGGMISEFFLQMQFGLEGLFASLAAIGPLVLLFLALIEVATGVQEILGPIIDSMLKPIIELLKGLGNALGTLLLPIFQALEPAINAIISVLKVFMPIFQLLEPVFKLIGNVIKAMMLPVVAFCIAIVYVINSIIDSINWAFGWAGAKLARLAIPTMPTFHQGGTAQEDTIALLKKGEVVLNPYKSKAYIAGGGVGGGITINAPNARYLDANMAAELVRMGLVAMRA